MNQEKIQKEKIAFLKRYSKQLYDGLFDKDENKKTVILLIADLLLNNNQLENCDEYKILNALIEEEDITEQKEIFVYNILSTITQFLTRLGAEESANTILTYFRYNEKKEIGKAKTLSIA